MTRSNKIAVWVVVVGAALCSELAVFLKSKVPDNLFGQSVAVEFTKGAWIECLSQPNSRVVLLSGSSDGITVLEEQPNISLVIKTPEGGAQCHSTGIAAIDGRSGVFFLPYSTIHSLEQNGRVVWSNPYAM